jgi:hypothetical protein
MCLVGIEPAGAADAPAEASAAPPAAQVNQDGWWNRFQGPQEGEPAGNPIRPLVPRIPAPPNVPGDSIAVGASANQVDKVAAVGIDVSGLPVGSLVDVLKVHLKESTQNGANVNADMAKVSACPATTPWGPDKNANWADRPQADCGLGTVEGQRAGGEWVFDLTALGMLWADPGSGTLPNGVVLSVEPVPGTVQVAWTGLDAGGVTLEVAVSAPPDQGSASDPYGSYTETAPATTTEAAPAFVPSESELSYDAGSASSSTDTYSGSTSGLESAAPVESAEAPAPAVPLPANTSGGRTNLKTRPVKVWGNLPPTSALLVPTVLTLALLLGWALGPSGRPLPAHGREGGLSRALARRRAGHSASEPSHGGIS